MRDKVERTAFPKSGDYLSVVSFVCKTPASHRDRIYVGGVLGKPGLFNFCLFPEPVVATSEQKALLQAAEAVAMLSGNGVSDESQH